MGEHRPVSLGRVILLGDSGFLGRRLKEHLQKTGSEVHGFSSKDLDLTRPEALSALDGVDGPDTCLMLVSGITPDKGVNVRSMTSNILIASNVAEYIEQHPVGQCVYFSSDAVYGFGDEPVSEATPPDLPNLYAVAKYTGERALQTVAGSKAIPLLIVRPTGIYGPGDTHGSYGPNRFIRTILQEGKVTLFGQGEELRDHVYVDDAVALIAGLAAGGHTGVFNIVTGTSRAFCSVVDDLREVVPTPFEVVNLPRSGSITHREYDASRLRRALPEFEFTPIRRGLEAIYKAAAAG
jgi:UDP-glucose 4-epimerase